jgi:primosomal protein N'
MIAQVVPVTRLRRATDWWSYKVPSNFQCLPGSLVSIPFRGRETLGVVWEIEKESEQATLSITRIITPYSLVHAPHRRLIEWLAEEGLCSLSTALYIWLPTALRNFPFTKSTQDLLEAHIPDVTNQTAQQLVFTPGKREYIESALKKRAENRFVSFFDSKSDKDELSDWLSIASGQKTIALGRERALFAPWHNLQKVIIQEPEDVSFYHEQIPYLNLLEATKVLAEASKAEVIIRTRIPQAAAELLWGEDVQGYSDPLPQIILTDLRRERLINEELLARIKQTLEAKKEILILYNAKDRIREKEGERILLPGVQTVGKQLAAALGCNELPPQIHFGTRSILTESYQNIGLTILLSIDPQLHHEHFADQVHGWADIMHLASYQAPLLVQGYQLDHPLVQALQNNRFAAYCTQIVEEQKEQAFLPFAEAILCTHPSDKESDPSAEKLYEVLRKLLEEPWSLSHPFSTVIRKKEQTALLLHAPQGSRVPAKLRSKLAALARPWKIQRNPWFTV